MSDIIARLDALVARCDALTDDLAEARAERDDYQAKYNAEIRKWARAVKRAEDVEAESDRLHAEVARARELLGQSERFIGALEGDEAASVEKMLQRAVVLDSLRAFLDPHRNGG